MIKNILLTIIVGLLTPSAVFGAVGDMVTYPISAYPHYMVSIGGNMWTANHRGTISEISPSGTVITSITGLPRPNGITSDGTNLFESYFNIATCGGSAEKISPTGTVLTSWSMLSSAPRGAAYDGTNLWVTDFGCSGPTPLITGQGNSVYKLSSTGGVTRYSGTGTGPFDIAFDGTNMWTANANGNSVTKITPTGGMVTYPGTGANPYGIAFDGTNMWTANYGDNSVTKISPTGGIVTYPGTGANPYSVAFDGTNMWTANYGDNSVTKISPTGGMVTYPGTGVNPQGITFDGTNMWTANYTGGSVTKIYAVAPVGTINTSSNISSSWTITGPATITGSGTSQTSASQPIGTYTITWNPVAGHVTPASQSFTLTSGGTINFNGTYTLSTAIPTVTTPTVAAIAATGAILGANVTSLGIPATISERGTCWGTTVTPTTNCTAATGLTTGVFTQARIGMTAGTSYHYRGYATNLTGTGYSTDGVFTTAIPTYIITAVSDTGGSITPATQTVSSGSIASLTVTPNAGYAVASVTGCGGSLVGATYSTGAITANCTITAYFVPLANVITASAGAGGTISPSGVVPVSYGASRTFAITPSSGYKISAVTVDGTNVGAVSTYTFSNVIAAHTIRATFSGLSFKYKQF